MSDAVQIQLIVGLVAVINGLILTVGTYFGRKLMLSAAAVERKADKAAVKVEEVAKTLETTTAATAKDLGEVKKDTKTTLKHVNSDRAILLNACAVALRRVAREKDATPEDIAAAKLAEQAYAAHQQAQAEVDSAKGIPEDPPKAT
jgi:hypothetical protein